MGLSSNILWHQTNEDSFYEILKSKKLLYSYSLEKIIPSFYFKPVAFPMISMSDYPVSEIGSNSWAYGDYCIGFRQIWGVKAGFSPVWYCSYGSRGMLQLKVLFEDALQEKSKGRIGAIMYLYAQMKFAQAPLRTKRKEFNKYRFYDEREWRNVPYITETDKAKVLPFLTEDKYKDYKEQHGGTSLLDIGVEFQYDDIHYIIVKNEDDVSKTRSIVGNRINIFTKSEVIEDVIGIEHHDEIKPSQELTDYEAAKRHVERMKSLFEEEWAKRISSSPKKDEQQ
jgi:hypothetical protein